MGQYVALLDILGFKDIINKNPHEEVIKIFENFRIYVQMSLANHKTMRDTYGRATYDVRDSTINSNIISDSLVFWTNDNNASGFFELVECLQSFTSFCHNLPKIFLRGGVSYGEFYYDNNGVIKGKDSLIIHPIMFGKALVDVYEIEKQLQIAGCIITDQAIQEAQHNNSPLFEEKWKALIGENKIVKYNIPTKKGVTDAWSINWVKDAANPDLSEISKAFSSFNKSIDDASVKEKMNNTIEYYNYVKANFYTK